MQPRHAVPIGAAQAMALFPGISRSGITIATGMLLGLGREAAARFSFLMAVPVIAGAGVWKARTLVGAGLSGAEIDQLIVGVVTSAIFGTAEAGAKRSEEHTSELQSPDHLVCSLLLEKKKRQWEE